MRRCKTLHWDGKSSDTQGSVFDRSLTGCKVDPQVAKAEFEVNQADFCAACSCTEPVPQLVSCLAYQWASACCWLISGPFATRHALSTSEPTNFKSYPYQSSSGHQKCCSVHLALNCAMQALPVKRLTKAATKVAAAPTSLLKPDSTLSMLRGISFAGLRMDPEDVVVSFANPVHHHLFT